MRYGQIFDKGKELKVNKKGIKVRVGGSHLTSWHGRSPI